jgi:hypothetical protein
MIEKHYGHITPVKNAERILQGLPGWEPMASVAVLASDEERVNADEAKPRGKPKPKRKPH